jgi:hypothetical protein
MRDLIERLSRYARRCRSGASIVLLFAVLAVPRLAQAQYDAPPLDGRAIGERYHAEFAGTFWSPTPSGSVSSEQFGLLGSKLDFQKDLAFTQTRFSELRIVLRPALKHKVRIEYNPIVYTSQSVLSRTITFNGINYPASLPITSELDWKVWRFGYEYDFFYADRGFVGALIEARSTQFEASLAGPGRAEFTGLRAPLPSIGIVGRGYVVPNVALNFEVSGMSVPHFRNYEANYFDWNISGTVNLTNNFGVQAGWRRMTTFIDINKDEGDLKFQGLWFGAAVRF